MDATHRLAVNAFDQRKLAYARIGCGAY